MSSIDANSDTNGAPAPAIGTPLSIAPRITVAAPSTVSTVLPVVPPPQVVAVVVIHT